MADVTGVDNLNSNSNGATSLTGIQSAVDNLNTAKQERSEEHTSELQSPDHLVCRLLLEKKKTYDPPNVMVHGGVHRRCCQTHATARLVVRMEAPLVIKNSGHGHARNQTRPRIRHWLYC